MIAHLPFISIDVHARPAIVKLVLASLALLLAITALRFGTYPLSTDTILRHLFIGGDGIERVIVIEHRLPRILVAVGTGMAVGLAGALFQTMLRNPLASPDWIGFTPGASFGALLAMYLTGGHIILGALAGTFVAATIVLGHSMQGGLNIQRLIIIGIGANLTIAAGADLLLARVDLLTAADMAKWLVGSLNGRDWTDVALIWVGLAVLLPLALWLEFPLRTMMLTDDVARGQGIAVSATRIWVAITGVLLVALGVCVAGPLPFVAFLCGPIAKALEGGSRPALFSAALIGAIVVLAADYIARLTPLVQLPAGVFTALIGGPYLLWLLVTMARKGRST